MNTKPVIPHLWSIMALLPNRHGHFDDNCTLPKQYKRGVVEQFLAYPNPVSTRKEDHIAYIVAVADCRKRVEEAWDDALNEVAGVIDLNTQSMCVIRGLFDLAIHDRQVLFGLYQQLMEPESGRNADNLTFEEEILFFCINKWFDESEALDA